MTKIKMVECSGNSPSLNSDAVIELVLNNK